MHRVENWDDLRYFLAVARTGGLSAAARQLGVNQSTVFRRIGQLEDSLDARLFERNPRGYELTAVGEDMLEAASRVEDDVFSLDRSVQGADREVRGTVRITTVEEVLTRIAKHLKLFCDEYPGIDLEVSTEQRVASLARREADVAIRPGGQPTEPEVVGRQLVALPMAAYASLEYLSGRKRPKREADLAKHRLIGFHKGRAGGRLLDRVVPDARVVYRADRMTGQAIAARAGLGIALLPRFVGDPDPDLERLFIVSLPEAFHLWLLVHADLRQTARVRAFIDYIAEAVLSDRRVFEGSGKRR
jgi:DNA-binding transcriptional LysR family regulator